MNATDLEGLLAAATPFLDVRAPLEFHRGTLPGAVNLPLLDDDERHQVGTTYKSQGHDSAVALGHRLVSGARRQAREDAWCAFADAHPGAWLYCWRGGERSAICQRWLRARGVDLPRVPGGFKALRQTCLKVLAEAPTRKGWWVLGGRTGSGKTALLHTLDNALDLEGLARHRGSAFGAWEEPQPTPISFENALAAALLQHRGAALVVEDESQTIGRLALPPGWHAHMAEAPLALLEIPLDQRVANIAREYVAEPLSRGLPAGTLHGRLSGALGRIERRLGGARRRAVQTALDAGFESGDHDTWIAQLLQHYYDPMYDHQLARKRRRVVVEGGPEEVGRFLAGL